MDTAENNMQPIADLKYKIEQLKKALAKYAECRHGNQDCPCTVEARAALWERK